MQRADRAENEQVGFGVLSLSLCGSSKHPIGCSARVWSGLRLIQIATCFFWFAIHQHWAQQILKPASFDEVEEHLGVAAR